MPTNSYLEPLTKAGLAPDQAAVYETLLKHGVQPASKVALKAGLTRPLGYKVLEELIEMGLVEKIDKKVALFAPAHPSQVRTVIEKRIEKLKSSDAIIAANLGAMISDYNLFLGKPNMRFLEGISGIEILYNDIITTGKDILLIRSPYDTERPELEKLVTEQIRRQIKAEIHTRALTPSMDDSIETASHLDAERLVTRCMVPRNSFMIPAQVIIYGDNVAITSYKEQLITTIIQNPDIRETFTMLFEYIWLSAQKEQQQKSIPPSISKLS